MVFSTFLWQYSKLQSKQENRRSTWIHYWFCVYIIIIQLLLSLYLVHPFICIHLNNGIFYVLSLYLQGLLLTYMYGLFLYMYHPSYWVLCVFLHVDCGEKATTQKQTDWWKIIDNWMLNFVLGKNIQRSTKITGSSEC